MSLTETSQLNAASQINFSSFIFNASKEAIMISDAQNVIVDVNQAFEKVTGFSRHEAVGKFTGFMKSGVHSSTFYKKMWQEIIRNDYWQGTIWDKNKNGRLYCKELTIGVVKDAEGNVENYLAIFSDTSEKMKYQRELENLAYYDSLTKLPNRARLLEKLNQMIDQVQVDTTPFHIAFIDIDKFKMINDTRGHSFGDLVLIAAANVIKEKTATLGVCGRVSGDEFLVIFRQGLSKHEVDRVVTDIKTSLEEPLDIDGVEFQISLSAGINSYPDLALDLKDLLSGADVAMYEAKKHSGSKCCWYNADIGNHFQQQNALEIKLTNAVKNNAFDTYFQPIIDLSTGEVYGCESLARWQPDGQDYLSPATFIPIAEKLTIFSELSAQLLQKSCAFIASLPSDFSQCLSVNVSGSEIIKPDFLGDFTSIIESAGLSKSNIQIEITETSFIENFEQAKLAIEALKNQGFKIALDDFGAGFSSLTYLNEFELDTIKLDRSLIKNIGESKNDIIIESIVNMAKRLGISVVAEGVEYVEQRDFLIDLGCDFAQGFFYQKPLTKVDYLKLFAIP